jgi:hypothetical protein
MRLQLAAFAAVMFFVGSVQSFWNYKDVPDCDEFVALREAGAQFVSVSQFFVRALGARSLYESSQMLYPTDVPGHWGNVAIGVVAAAFVIWLFFLAPSQALNPAQSRLTGALGFVGALAFGIGIAFMPPPHGSMCFTYTGLGLGYYLIELSLVAATIGVFIPRRSRDGGAERTVKR